MREVVGDLWEQKADAIVVPINWRVNRAGLAIMGAGVAKQAADRFPSLRVRLGEAIRGSRLLYSVPFQCGPATYLLCFPTKRDWRDPSDLELIGTHLPWLVSHADIGGWSTVTLPRLGCGNGGLSWDDVRPIFAEHLDDRFVVVHPIAARQPQETTKP